jgi:hypothetical protein
MGATQQMLAATGAGGGSSGAMWDGANSGAGAVLSNGNKTYTSSTGAKQVISDTFRSTGKYYFELDITTSGSSQLTLGLYIPGTPTGGNWPGAQTGSFGIIGAPDAAGQDMFYNGSGVGTLTNGTTGLLGVCVACFALDLDAHKIWIGRNNVWYASGNPGAGTNPAYASLAGGANLGPGMLGQLGCVTTLRTASADLIYTPPSGFSSWY